MGRCKVYPFRWYGSNPRIFDAWDGTSIPVHSAREQTQQPADMITFMTKSY